MTRVCSCVGLTDRLLLKPTQWMDTKDDAFCAGRKRSSSSCCHLTAAVLKDHMGCLHGFTCSKCLFVCLKKRETLDKSNLSVQLIQGFGLSHGVYLAKNQVLQTFSTKRIIPHYCLEWLMYCIKFRNKMETSS